jgi:hypothetical protein
MGNPLPSVLAILLCDQIIIDVETGKKTLVGVFEGLRAEKYPIGQKMAFYARLTDLEGHYKFVVRIVRLDGDKEELMGGAEAEYTAKHQLAILEIALNLPPVPFSGPGRYEFQLFADEIYIGRATLNAS